MIIILFIIPLEVSSESDDLSNKKLICKGGRLIDTWGFHFLNSNEVYVYKVHFPKGGVRWKTIYETSVDRIKVNLKNGKPQNKKGVPKIGFSVNRQSLILDYWKFLNKKKKEGIMTYNCKISDEDLIEYFYVTLVNKIKEKMKKNAERFKKLREKEEQERQKEIDELKSKQKI